ncbi:hypothetical protein KAW08_02575 [bacterium]|nr:hypothetical protein [bacterium]
MTLKNLVFGLVVLCSSGCSSIPFEKVQYVSVSKVQPAAILKQFASALPQEFQVVNTIVFQYKWRKFSAIGYTDIDALQKLFTVVCLNHAGIKLFELAGNDNSVECKFAFEGASFPGNFAKAVGDDIRRIYFDCIPNPESRIYKKKNKIVFRQPAEEGVMEYTFAGTDNLLIEKQYYKGWRKIWSVFYYEYRRKNGKLYPSGIMLKHHKYNYQLTVRLKEIQT